MNPLAANNFHQMSRISDPSENGGTLADYGVSALRGGNNVLRTLGGVADYVADMTHEYMPEFLTTPINYYADSAKAGQWLDKNQPQYQRNPHGARDLLSFDDDQISNLYSEHYRNNVGHEILKQAPTVATTIALSRTPVGALLTKGAARFLPFAKAGTINMLSGVGYDFSDNNQISAQSAGLDFLLGGYTPKFGPALSRLSPVVKMGRPINEISEAYKNVED